MNTVRLIMTFYKSFAFLSFIITYVCLGLIYGLGKNGIHMIQVFFWFKIYTLAVILYFTNVYKKNEIYCFNRN